MHQVDVSEATQQLPILLAAAVRGEVVLITTTDRHVVRLVVQPSQTPRRAGSAKGLIHIADDFDAPLADFQDYGV